MSTAVITATVLGLPPPDSVIVGADVYPLPGLVKVIAVTAPPDSVAVAVAPVPPPPLNATVGAELYPAPAVPMVNLNPCIASALVNLGVGILLFVKVVSHVV